jgi:uroporphyrinogen-III decarboxylase
MKTWKKAMTTRERVRAVVRREPTDHLPLSFTAICHGVIGFLYERVPDKIKQAEFLMNLGVDAGVTITPPDHTLKRIEIKAWREDPPDERYPVLHKEYRTPRGTLRQVVRKTEDYGSDIRLFADHNVPPSRSKTYLVESEENLDALEYLLRMPDDDELRGYREDAKASKAFCDAHGIFLSGYLAGVGDPLIWLSGVARSVTASFDDPGFMERYVAIIAKWNRARLALLLEAGADIIVRRGWYESTDFWSPTLFRQYLHGPLKGDIELAHQAGALFTYVMNSGAMPLLDQFNDLGFDIYSNIDPMTPHMDLEAIKKKVGGRITLCGGVNNNQILERGTDEQVQRAVQDAVEKLGPDGFILAPGDSILATSEKAVHNFYVMIDAWKHCDAAAPPD